jgi:pyrroloquinoline quinone biosynthesis protein D
MSDLPEKPKLSSLYRLQFEKAQDAYVLLYPEGMVKLNTSAAEILKRCNGDLDISQLVGDLETAFSTTGLRAEVENFLHTAVGRGWIH